MSEAEQSSLQIISFLQQPTSYPHHPAAVTLVQTHASVLALAPPFVYKVKKHVDLGFMKFTTLQERKTNCERERQLNSRFCPDLYVAVLPIAQQEGQLRFGTDGEIVEYALQMNLLPDGYFADQLLQANQLTAEMLEAVLAVLKAFYETYRSDASVSAYGELPAIRKIVEDNLTMIGQRVGELVHPVSFSTISFYLRTFMERHEALFRKRVQELRIQDCHGDLHLDHIHIWQDKISIFDCIEFNDRFRYTDVASDIAFLAMDLDFHGRPELATYVSGRMAELLQDPDMQLLMDFYKCARACVRAKVECFRAEEEEVPAAERQLSRERAGKYISLALRYALFGSKPAVLLVMGKTGSGKTTVARNIAQLLDCRHLNSDVIRKETAGLPLYQRPSSAIRESLYSNEASDAVYQRLLQEALATVSNGHYMVVDATFGSRNRRAAFAEALEQQHLMYYFLEMQAPDDVLRKRLAQREHCAEEVSDARLEDFDHLRLSYQEPDEIPAHRLLRADAEKKSDEVLQTVLTELAQRKALLPLKEAEP
ncbi:bifunctional aminoglycoside phosphotransferase/ATP-binding protein [Botryobacter ruber]|uniref:bifunctional aminoglycoside phosphotransferase/ATP-binding protein n=1 Tax=Botryobacter ruber TaxID=2171629 RepID=UPI000E0B8EAD|nr:nucleoside monophosphate kinase [Botryobacter ruber]